MHNCGQPPNYYFSIICEEIWKLYVTLHKLSLVFDLEFAPHIFTAQKSPNEEIFSHAWPLPIFYYIYANVQLANT